MLKTAAHKVLSLVLIPLLMVASITWVSQKHFCLSECAEVEETAHANCCEQPIKTIKASNEDSCCADEDSCGDKDCCVDEKIILDKTIDELERAQRKNQSIALFDFLFAPLTQDYNKTAVDPDSVKSNECGSPDEVGKSVSIYLIHQNIRC